jgi:hypothetical protein
MIARSSARCEWPTEESRSRRPPHALARPVSPSRAPVPLPCPAVARPRPRAGGALPVPRRLPSPPVHQAPAAGSAKRHWQYPRRVGQMAHGGLFNVDNFTGNVDGVVARNFFRAQAVDGIDAGSGDRGRRSLYRVPTRILSLRTGSSACLHRISTGLCTLRLDAGRRAPQDCRSHLLQLSWRRVRATGCESVGTGRGVR